MSTFANNICDTSYLLKSNGSNLLKINLKILLIMFGNNYDMT